MRNEADLEILVDYKSILLCQIAIAKPGSLSSSGLERHDEATVKHDSR